ncbi:MAG: hypothetical protein M3N95_01195 [Actinomycetota bacterium]|nr:hypothetical protein [Actinomycetota bacterium]
MTEEAPEPEVELNLLGSLAVVLVVGVGLVFAARAGALALLIAVAVVQALLAVAWIFATSMPGRIGGLFVAAGAAAGSDLAVSIWPHSRLETLLAVFALAIPLMFVHQLSRGAARVRIVESLSGVAMLVAAVTAVPALLQLRHEFAPSSAGAHVVAGVTEAAAGALIVGYLVDMIMPAPRFDAAIGRGLLAVVAAAGLGGSVGHLAITGGAQFHGARGAFIGAALGALVGLLAVAVAFVEFASPPAGGLALRARPVLSALLPLSLIAPIAFLLCLAIRS